MTKELRAGPGGRQEDMNYSFRCPGKHTFDVEASIHDGPPARPRCGKCGRAGERVWTVPYIATSTDPDQVAEKFRVTEDTALGTPKAAAIRKEKAYARHVAELRAAGQRKDAPMRMTHSVPTELFHGKIKESGDKAYWSDPKNLEKHRSCKVS